MRQTTAFALMVAHTDIIASLDAECADHEAHIEAHHIRDAENANIISGLRIQLEDAINRAANAEKYLRENEEYASEARTAMSAETAALRLLVSKLKKENHKLRYGGSNTTETALTYMKNHGVEVWGGSPDAHTSVIRVVQEITGWELRETKEFCENYIRSESVEVSGPQTKRSQRAPEGVGVVERPIQVAMA